MQFERYASLTDTLSDSPIISSDFAALTRDILFEKALYQGACKAAIKAGRVYAEGHIEWLVGKLMELPSITACPHGRPVAMEISKQHLDHQFERS